MNQGLGFATVQAKLLADVRTESYSPTKLEFQQALPSNVPASGVAEPGHQLGKLIIFISHYKTTCT